VIPRPQSFTLNRRNKLFSGLVFAGLGGYNCPTTLLYADSSDFGSSGTLINMDGTNWSFDPTLGRYALTHNGTDEYVAFPGRSIVGSLTMSIWCTTADRTVANKFLFSLGYNSTGSVMLYQNKSQITFIGYTGAQARPNGNAGDMIANDTWAHLVLRLTGKSLSIFVDGVSRPIDYDGTLESEWVGTTPTGDYCIGYALPRNLSTSRWSGKTSDPMLWARALSDGEIQTLADPSDPTLDGLIVGVASRSRVYFPTAIPPATTTRNLIIGGGII